MLYFFMKFNLRLLYLYLFSFVGLLIVVIGSIQMVNLGLKTFVFKNADSYFYNAMPVLPKSDPGYIDPETLKKQQEEQIKNQRQNDFAWALSMMVIGTPLYLYHWKTIGKESKV